MRAWRSGRVRIANAPCSWGVIEGIDGDRDGYRRVIDEMQATGYAGTELGEWGFMPTRPGTSCARELVERGLALVGSWVSVRPPRSGATQPSSADDAVRTARQLARVGGPESVVVLGNDPYGDPYRTRIAGRVPTSDAWPRTSGACSPRAPTTSPGGSWTRPGSGPSSTSTSAP